MLQLRIEKLINFNMICMWTFHTNSLLHYPEYLAFLGEKGKDGSEKGRELKEGIA